MSDHDELEDLDVEEMTDEERAEYTEQLRGVWMAAINAAGASLALSGSKGLVQAESLVAAIASATEWLTTTFMRAVDEDSVSGATKSEVACLAVNAHHARLAMERALAEQQVMTHLMDIDSDEHAGLRKALGLFVDDDDDDEDDDPSVFFFRG